MKEDAEEEWLYAQKFDYIHLRTVFSAFEDPRKVLKHAVANLNPGGWIEYCDFVPIAYSPDGSHEGSTMQKYINLIAEGLRKAGRDPMVTRELKGWLSEEGCATCPLFPLFLDPLKFD